MCSFQNWEQNSKIKFCHLIHQSYKMFDSDEKYQETDIYIQQKEILVNKKISVKIEDAIKQIKNDNRIGCQKTWFELPYQRFKIKNTDFSVVYIAEKEKLIIVCLKYSENKTSSFPFYGKCLTEPELDNRCVKCKMMSREFCFLQS